MAVQRNVERMVAWHWPSRQSYIAARTTCTPSNLGTRQAPKTRRFAGRLTPPSPVVVRLQVVNPVSVYIVVAAGNLHPAQRHHRLAYHHGHMTANHYVMTVCCAPPSLPYVHTCIDITHSEDAQAPTDTASTNRKLQHRPKRRSPSPSDIPLARDKSGARLPIRQCPDKGLGVPKSGHVAPGGGRVGSEEVGSMGPHAFCGAA